MAVQFFWGGFLFLTHIPFSSGSWGQFQRPYGCENDVVLESNASVIDELKVRSRTECAYHCGLKSNCTGFNLEELANTKSTCQLLSRKSDQHGSFMRQKQGYAYYERAQDGILHGTYTCSAIDSSVRCPEGWVRFKDACYLFDASQNVDFDNATSLCKGYGAHLVAITTQEENSFLVDFIKDNFDHNTISYGFMTGGNDIALERKWEWDYYGTLVENGFEAWDNNEGTGHYSLDERHMKLYSLNDQWLWHDFVKTDHSPFICELDLRSNPTMFEVMDRKRVTYEDYDFLAVKVRIPENDTCLSGDCCLEYQKLCAFLGPFKPTGCSRPFATDKEGKLRCESVYNADMNIDNTLSCNPSQKIKEIAILAFGGASGAVNGNSFGTKSCHSHKCTTNLSTTNDNRGLHSLDTALSSSDRMAFTVCREDAGQCTCPAGYIMHGCSCYKFKTEKSNFDVARSSCQADCAGCDLVAIENSDEMTYIRDMIKNTPLFASAGHWWMDAYDSDQDNAYHHLSKNSAEMKYYDWYLVGNEPNHVSEQCIIMYDSFNYQWADVTCAHNANYICERDMRVRGCTCPTY